MTTTISQTTLSLIEKEARESNDTAEALLRRLLEGLVTTPDFSSASVVAEDNTKWSEWSRHLYVTQPIKLTAENPIWEDIQHLIQSTTYSVGLRSASTFLKNEFKEEKQFVQRIEAWSATIDACYWNTNATPDVLKLFVPWWMTKKAIDEKSHELAQRALGDAVLKTVFSGRVLDDESHEVRFEQNTLLSVAPGSPIKLMNAIADVLVFRALPPGKLDVLLDLEEVDLDSMRCVDLPDPGDLHIGTFFAEWKKQDLPTAVRQASFYAFAIQNHRRLLGLSDRDVFGTVMANGVIYLMVSCWHTNIVRSYYTEDSLSWDVRDPAKVVELFYFLVSLKSRIDREVLKDFEEFDSLKIKLEFAKERRNNWEAALNSRKSSKRSTDVLATSSNAGGETGKRRRDDGYRDDEYEIDVDDAECVEDGTAMESEVANGFDDGSSDTSVSSAHPLPKKVALNKLYSVHRWTRGEESWISDVTHIDQLLELAS